MDVVYWDTRELKGNLPVETVWDVRVFYSWDGDLPGLVRRVEPEGMGEFLDLDRRASAHLRAASEGRVDPAVTSRKLIPDDLFHEYAQAREAMAVKLFGMKDQTERKHYEQHIYPLLRDVRKIERNGIHIDVGAAVKLLRWNDLQVHERAFMNSTIDLLKGPLVYSKITPVGTRTGRMGVEGGFKCMSVPHGVCRQVMNSRFEKGKIVTLDFNAIDYRCLVTAVNDPRLNKFYADCRDFHSKTAALFGEVTSDLRSMTKKVTYMTLYGGSMQTLQKETGKSKDELLQIGDTLLQLFEPIVEFRLRMAERARKDGYVFTPSGVPVKVEKDDHDGKIVGLYAQSYSSEVFAKALHEAMEFLAEEVMRSMVIFTVHDEIVFDVPENERHEIAGVAQLIENATGFVVKMKEGWNYGDATDG